MHAKPWVVLAATAALLPAGCAADPVPEIGRPDQPATVAPVVPIKCVGHTAAVGSVAISPDGRLIASGGNDGTLRFWNAADGRSIRTVQAVDPPGDFAAVYNLCFLPDGKIVAAKTMSRTEALFRFWDTTTGEEIKDRAVEMDDFGLAYSPDGTKLAVAGPKEVRLLDAANYHQLQSFPVKGGTKAAFSKDGKVLAVALPRRDQSEKISPAVRAWDLETGREVFAGWDEHIAKDVTISANGKLVAGGGDYYRGLIKVWDLASQRLLHTLQADKEGVFCVVCSPSGNTLASSGNEPAIKLWDLATGALIGKLEGHQDKPYELAFSADGRTLVSSGRDKHVMIWQITPR